MAEKVAEKVLMALASNPEGIQKKDLMPLIVNDFDGATKPQALKIVTNDSWLKERSEWVYDGGVVRIA